MQELPLNPFLVIELFNACGINFMGSFMSSYGMKYILVVVDYVSKSLEAITLANNEKKSVTAFLNRTYFQDLSPQGQLLAMGYTTFAKSFSKGYWRNMGFATIWTLLTILRLVGKLTWQTKESSRFWRKR